MQLPCTPYTLCYITFLQLTCWCCCALVHSWKHSSNGIQPKHIHARTRTQIHIILYSKHTRAHPYATVQARDTYLLIAASELWALSAETSPLRTGFTCTTLWVLPLTTIRCCCIEVDHNYKRARSIRCASNSSFDYNCQLLTADLSKQKRSPLRKSGDLWPTVASNAHFVIAATCPCSVARVISQTQTYVTVTRTNARTFISTPEIADQKCIDRLSEKPIRRLE